MIDKIKKTIKQVTDKLETEKTKARKKITNEADETIVKMKKEIDKQQKLTLNSAGRLLSLLP